ncbi:Claudin-3, partial [Manis pentadactyla]
MTDIEADGVGSETLALRKELGSGSDVTGVQDVGTGLWLRCLIRSMGEIGLQLDSDPSMIVEEALGDVDADVLWIGPGISARFKILCSLWFPETLALRKELGSGSDVTGVQDVGTGFWLRCLIRSMGEIGLQLDSDPSMIKDNFRIKAEVSDNDARARAGIRKTLALRKELGSGSYVTGSARCWNRAMVKCEILTKGLGLALV